MNGNTKASIRCIILLILLYLALTFYFTFSAHAQVYSYTAAFPHRTECDTLHRYADGDFISVAVTKDRWITGQLHVVVVTDIWIPKGGRCDARLLRDNFMQEGIKYFPVRPNWTRVYATIFTAIVLFALLQIIRKRKWIVGEGPPPRTFAQIHRDMTGGNDG